VITKTGRKSNLWRYP